MPNILSVTLTGFEINRPRDIYAVCHLIIRKQLQWINRPRDIYAVCHLITREQLHWINRPRDFYAVSNRPRDIYAVSSHNSRTIAMDKQTKGYLCCVIS
jgi:hypothetical protein